MTEAYGNSSFTFSSAQFIFQFFFWRKNIIDKLLNREKLSNLLSQRKCQTRRKEREA